MKDIVNGNMGRIVDAAGMASRDAADLIGKAAEDAGRYCAEQARRGVEAVARASEAGSRACGDMAAAFNAAVYG